jgi:hypothetical protein
MQVILVMAQDEFYSWVFCTISTARNSKNTPAYSKLLKISTP